METRRSQKSAIPAQMRFELVKTMRPLMVAQAWRQTGNQKLSSMMLFSCFRFFLTLIVIQERWNPDQQAFERNTPMNQTTISAIQALLKSDNTVTEEQAQQILNFCKKPTVRRRLITAREAQKMLSCSRPTLRFLVKQGRLQQINFSCRRVRFDFDEVQRFANNGATAEMPEAAKRP